MYDGRRPRYKPVNTEWVYEKVQERLSSPIGSAVLKTYIEEVQCSICNYINRGYVPEPLRFVFLNLTMDLLKSQALAGNLDNDSLADASIGTVASIKDGDSEIKFATTKTNTGAHVADVDSLLYNYQLQLDKYRIFKW